MDREREKEGKRGGESRSNESVLSAWLDDDANDGGDDVDDDLGEICLMLKLISML